MWVHVQKLCVCVHAESHQSCPILCNLMACGPPDSFVHGILQARILEWVATPSFWGSSQPRNQTHVSYVSCVGRWVLYQERHLEAPQKLCRGVTLEDRKGGGVSIIGESAR